MEEDRQEGGPEPDDEEVDLSALQWKLGDLDDKVERAQSRLAATIKARHAEFTLASGRITDLRGAVARLRGDLHLAAGQLGTETVEPETATSLETPGPVPQLHAAMRRHAALEEELQALKAADTVLRTIQQVQQQLSELDALTSSGCYSDAARRSLEIAEALERVSAPDAASEPSALQSAKLQYYQRRSGLLAHLNDAFEGLIDLKERHVVVRQHMFMEATASRLTLPEVWAALDILDLRKRRVDQLAHKASRFLLRPLLEAGRKLRPSHNLKPEKGSTAASQETGMVGEATWTWTEILDDWDGFDDETEEPQVDVRPRPQSKKGLAGWQPSASAVLPALESLFLFMQEHWACKDVKVCGLLGSQLWPVVTRALLQHFDTCGSDGGKALEQFEHTMIEKGLISSKERTLSRHVHEHKKALGLQRRAATLDEARSWLLLEDAALVSVSEEEELGSITALLRQDAGSGANKPVLATSLRQVLEDGGLLRLPNMHVSTSTHKLVTRLRSLMEEVAEECSRGQIDAAADTNKLIRELCALFAVLRPFVQKGQLKSNAKYCAVFLADCLYMVHALLLMPYRYSQRIPKEHNKFVSLMDIVPQLRRLGESHFLAMLQWQREQITETLRSCDCAAAAATDTGLTMAETAVGSALQHVKTVAQGLSAALPSQVLREVSIILLGVVCRDLLAKLFQVQRCEPHEVAGLSALFTTALATVRLVCTAMGLAPVGKSRNGDAQGLLSEIPGFEALGLVADLLGSDFSRFREQSVAVVKVFTREEAVTLMQLSWHNEMFSPEAAWDVLSRKAGEEAR